MTKVPTRSPTHEDIDLGRLAAMGLELEEIADGETVALRALVELSEDRGRPASHYVAAIPLATELRLAGDAALELKICAGNCQRYGALDLVDALLAKPAVLAAARLVPVSCLDRCDQAPACELHGAHGALVLAPATADGVVEAIAALR